MSGQIRLIGTILIPQDQQVKMLPLLEQHSRLSNLEPGCIEFEAVQDTAQPDTFHVRELFENQSAFDLHQARSSASPWGKASAGLQRNFKKTSLA